MKFIEKNNFILLQRFWFSSDWTMHLKKVCRNLIGSLCLCLSVRLQTTLWLYEGFTIPTSISKTLEVLRDLSAFCCLQALPENNVRINKWVQEWVILWLKCCLQVTVHSVSVHIFIWLCIQNAYPVNLWNQQTDHKSHTRVIFLCS